MQTIQIILLVLLLIANVVVLVISIKELKKAKANLKEANRQSKEWELKIAEIDGAFQRLIDEEKSKVKKQSDEDERLRKEANEIQRQL